MKRIAPMKIIFFTNLSSLLVMKIERRNIKFTKILKTLYRCYLLLLYVPSSKKEDNLQHNFTVNNDVSVTYYRSIYFIVFPVIFLSDYFSFIVAEVSLIYLLKNLVM